jgi:hypothetical protein
MKWSYVASMSVFSPPLVILFVYFPAQYEGERDLKTATDFINGGGQLKGGSSAAAGTAESEDDDDDVSDTKPSKGKTSGTRSRPARTATPTVSRFAQVFCLHPTPDAKGGLVGRQSSWIPQ